MTHQKNTMKQPPEGRLPWEIMRRTQSKVRGKIPRKETQGEIDTEGTITTEKHEENDAPLHDPAHSDAKLA